ncbi:glycosyltransferase involved in cell wall biosynthesis [Salinibacter ruber]|uniref:glycosyltransferase family 4 protein n=1 Tax=Salinibacter ruber TaxID=146919 RepID=UPI002167F140|nr:glycosyltransferase family 4 protein [Salinibacter ruber]MCS3628955.1 glycosyltransferase involved in cell wall biosynthesis [Salinibacter ruber]MCS4145864.1 glycosyltransferase involved in cell wall biosynthesis [Salinibacter ruber]
MIKLAVVNTHPIQYYSPYYRQLADRDELNLRVFYTWRGPLDKAYDPGFEQEVSWDIPLLDGYDHTFVENTASDPGTHHFRGIVAPSLIHEIESWGADAVLVFSWNYQTHLRVLLHFSGRCPVLFRGDSTLLDESPGPKKWARRLWLRWVYRHVDAALYVGRNNRAYYEAHGLGEDQLFWVPHAIDNTRFAESNGADQKAAEWRRELSIPDTAPVVLFAGKLGRKKAPDLLVEAFSKVTVEDAHLAIVGSGPMGDELRSMAETQSRIHFLGFQNQARMPVVYRLGDIFVLPSRGPGETWGLAVNEAMACGRPVVVTDRVGCAPDLVDGENGAVVPAGRSTPLQKTLEDLLEDRGRLQDMGRRSRKRISNWSVNVAASRTASAVRETVCSG